jgi:hypothetical protein
LHAANPEQPEQLVAHAPLPLQAYDPGHWRFGSEPASTEAQVPVVSPVSENRHDWHVPVQSV